MSLKWSTVFSLFLVFLFTGNVLAQGNPGAVYVASNSAAGNSVMRFVRNADGTLAPGGSFSTGGLGTGSGLGNQGGLILSRDDRWLFVVNAGSDDISAFAVTRDGLRLTDRKPSGGQRPLSLTESRSILYVVNAGGAVGGSDNISGFYVTRRGKLFGIPNSTQPLNQASTGPAQIGFNSDSNALLVTEKATNQLAVFRLDRFGRARPGEFVNSNGATPFGFALGKRDQVFVSDAAGGAPGASALSAYEFEGGKLNTIGQPVPSTQTAACWVVVTADGRLAFTTNTGSNTLSEFALDFDGAPTLVNATAAFTSTPGPIDMALSQGDRYLYVLEGGVAVEGLELAPDGSLTHVTGVAVPRGSNGLAVR